MCLSLEDWRIQFFKPAMFAILPCLVTIIMLPLWLGFKKRNQQTEK